METKSLLIGLSSFIAGGLLVSIAATTFEKPQTYSMGGSSNMNSMAGLEFKAGDEFDEAFISEMIVHHRGAIEMAHLAGKKATHTEIKDLSKNIISAQEKEINQMKRWQKQWGYDEAEQSRSTH